MDQCHIHAFCRVFFATPVASHWTRLCWAQKNMLRFGFYCVFSKQNEYMAILETTGETNIGDCPIQCCDRTRMWKPSGRSHNRQISIRSLLDLIKYMLGPANRFAYGHQSVSEGVCALSTNRNAQTHRPNASAVVEIHSDAFPNEFESAFDRCTCRLRPQIVSHPPHRHNLPPIYTMCIINCTESSY